jgi:23S rRNA (uridine2552-2'-O)-methyltransferase
MRKIKDYYFKKAKQDKYPARSVYKLEEIDNKCRLIKKDIKILDIGCSPGSWSQFMLKKIGSGSILGIDINNSIRIEDTRFTFMPGNIFDIESSRIQKYIQAFDLITSDAAPNTTGDSFIDSQKSLNIVKRVFQIARDTLKPGGSVVAKVFQGEDLKVFVDGLKEDFSRVILFKPKSSRKESREIFLIAITRRCER